jgi:hypothetical protein
MHAYKQVPPILKKGHADIQEKRTRPPVRGHARARSYGILIFLPFMAIYFASEIRIISLDINGILIIAGILSAIDIALYFVGTAVFQREEILTKWK